MLKCCKWQLLQIVSVKECVCVCVCVCVSVRVRVRDVRSNSMGPKNVCKHPQSSQYLLLSPPAGDGVLWRRVHHRSGEEHQGQHTEGGLDRLHLPRDPQGQSSFTAIS